MTQETQRRRTNRAAPDNDNNSSESAFAALGLSRRLCDTVANAGYTTPTPIQKKAIPDVLAGRDLLGCAQTGTGKTAAFALPILDQLSGHRRDHGRQRGRGPCVLVLAPTRELAAQIGDSFRTYGRGTGLRGHVIFGGVGKGPQKKALRDGLEILVATPGRLLDLMGEGLVDLSGISHFVLDEADRMLDMGFIRDVRRIIREIPRERQTLLFSATMPTQIRTLSREILNDPLHVAVDPVSSTCEPTSQGVHFVDQNEKTNLLLELLNDAEVAIDRVLVFTRTKHRANRVTKQLCRADVPAAAIHGNKSQAARERALAGFKRGDLRVMVATDIAARGIDIKDLSHVVNYDLPNEPESYVHRVGRTGRAGLAGAAIAFCSPDERDYLRDIERLTKRPLDRIGGIDRAPTKPAPRPQSRGGNRNAPRSTSRNGDRTRNGNGNGNRNGNRDGGRNGDQGDRASSQNGDRNAPRNGDGPRPSRGGQRRRRR